MIDKPLFDAFEMVSAVMLILRTYHHKQILLQVRLLEYVHRLGMMKSFAVVTMGCRLVLLGNLMKADCRNLVDWAMVYYMFGACERLREPQLMVERTREVVNTFVQ